MSWDVNVARSSSNHFGLSPIDVFLLLLQSLWRAQVPLPGGDGARLDIYKAFSVVETSPNFDHRVAAGVCMKIYQKTDKGWNEVATRVHRLPPRLQQALILVDGHRDEKVLSALIPGGISGVLDSLLYDGFISVVDAVPAGTEGSAASP